MVVIPEQKKKILITSALPYVNNVPHLGNLIGCVLSADVYARYQRSAGRKVLYVCGTDEHGTTTEAKAREEGITPKEICDKYYGIHKDIYDWFNISFDHFGRTSAENHVVRTQEIFTKLQENGFVLEKEEEQLYSEESKVFLSDRYIEGTCPYCGYEKARGDQCDSCGKLLQPHELINPVSTIDGAKPVMKKTTHQYLALDKLQEELEVWAKNQKEHWTQNSWNITKSWFDEGLQARAITRDLQWGVPVPGKEGKVFYVWFDAPIGYISITEQAGLEWKEWWQDRDTRLYQFMGKDNVPFHSILFPASLIGTREEWTLPYHINTTEFLNFENAKFSKSNGTGVFGDGAKESGIPADVWRYYLLINRPETADTVFLWDDFQDRLNNELVANLGNLVNRTVSFIARQCDGFVAKQELCEENHNFWSRVQQKEQKITDALEKVCLKEALREIMSLAKMGNQFFQEQEPWKIIKTNRSEAEESLFILANLIKDLAILIEPYLPDTAQSIFRQLGIGQLSWQQLGEFDIQGPIGEPELLFKKLDSVEELRERFGSKVERLDLRVAKIERVEKHPDADKLYIEHLDLGELGKRTIVSGLVEYYTPEELEGKKIVVFANLRPAKLRGVKSEGMLLAAEHDGVVEVLESTGNPGEQVTLQGITPRPAKEVTIDDVFALKMQVKNHIPLIEGKKLSVKKTKLSQGIIR